MGWLIGDNGFEMSLSARVPDLIATHLAPAVAEMLAAAGVGGAEVASWAEGLLTGAEVMLPAGQRIEYKYVILEEQVRPR